MSKLSIINTYKVINRINLLLFVLLLLSMFIYLFYRTENTLINWLFIEAVGYENFHLIREVITNRLHLSPSIVYSLPEGIWVLCITVTSSYFKYTYRKKTIHFIYLPILFAVLLELFQLLGITNGTFDLTDLLFASFCWGIPYLILKKQTPPLEVTRAVNSKHLTLYLSYGIVYLAHVMN